MKTRSITIALLCMLAFAFSHVLAQSPNLTEIIIGEGTETSCEVPFNSCEWGRHWGYSESIYPAEAIGEPCLIYSISFDISEVASYWDEYQNTTALYVNGLDVYIGSSEQSTHTTTEWMPIESMIHCKSLQYVMYFQSQGWITLELDTPFL